MNKQIKVLLTFLLLLAFSIACDETTTEPDQIEAKALHVKEIQVPDALKQSSDQKATFANAYISSMNSLANGFSAWLSAPAGSESLAKTNDDRSYTWSAGGISITMNYSENGDNYTWEVFLNGTDGEGLTFNNFKFLEAAQNKNESEGYLKIFEDNSSNLSSTWSWVTNTNDVYSMTFGGDDNDRIEVNSNPDESGELLFYENNVLVSRTVWTSAGTGEWTEFDSGGNITDSGTF
ncbi:MAG: hypothetical protein GY936_14420 [Ignavibacteriae bacterium]|nr:hypothetical protein [Ignavibacteriota bacterium]